MLYLLATHPEQYELVRADPELIPAAVDESLRLGSPVRAFTRLAIAPYRTVEVSVAEGERVLLLYGAANRDERHYPDPDRFDVRREAADQFAFGFGVHRCAGGHLALLEMQSLLRAVAARVQRIEVGEPEVLMSNMLNGYASLPSSFA
jgi:cytochrome P450